MTKRTRWILISASNALPESSLKAHVQKRYRQLTFETDILPNIILVEEGDNITGPGYAFVGNRGLLSDLYEENGPGEHNFSRPFENVSFLEHVKLFEALLLISNEDGYWTMIPETVVEAHPDLHYILTSEEQGGLSPPQPL